MTMEEHSQYFDFVQAQYLTGKWSEKSVRLVVGLLITQEDCDAILEKKKEARAE